VPRIKSSFSNFWPVTRSLARPYRRSGVASTRAVDSQRARIKYRGRLLCTGEPSLTRRGKDTTRYLIFRRCRAPRKIECLFAAIIHRSYRRPPICRDSLPRTEVSARLSSELANRGEGSPLDPARPVIVERRICRHVFYDTAKLPAQPRPKGEVVIKRTR